MCILRDLGLCCLNKRATLMLMCYFLLRILLYLHMELCFYICT
nr:hypothetical protein - human adenovirus 12 [Human adenovirus 12]